MRLGTLGLVLAAAGSVGASDGEPTTERVSPETLAVSIEFSRGGEYVSQCSGVLWSGRVLTAQHCSSTAAAEAEAGGPVTLRLSDGSRIVLPRDAVRSWRSVPLARIGGSFGQDFFVIRDTGLTQSNLDPMPIAGHPRRGGKVSMFRAGAKPLQCEITQVCGGTFSYSCKPGSGPGWSGSGVWEDTGSGWKLIGIHKNGYGQTGSATSFTTILGRSSYLFEGNSRFATTFARERSFAYVKDPEASCQTTALPFRLLNSRRRFQGLAVADEGRLLTSAPDLGMMCLVNVATGRPKCTQNPNPRSNTINAIIGLGEGLFALPEASSANSPGAVSFVRLDPSSGRLDFSPIDRPRVQSAIGSMYAVANVGQELIVGGAQGLCGVNATACARLCNDQLCSASWKVNAIVPLGPDRFLALGVDYGLVDNVEVGRPQCIWFVRVDGQWTVESRCGLRPSLLKEAMRLGAGRPLALKAPVVLDGGVVVAFSSQGVAYQLVSNGILKPVPIDGLDPTGGQIEDAVRDAVLVDAGTIAVASSDGTMRLLSIRGAGETLRLRASPERTAYDLGIWATRLAVGPTWIAVATQDGNIQIVDWRSRHELTR